MIHLKKLPYLLEKLQTSLNTAVTVFLAAICAFSSISTVQAGTWMDEDGTEVEVPDYPYFHALSFGGVIQSPQTSNTTLPPFMLGVSGVEMWKNYPLATVWRAEAGNYTNMALPLNIGLQWDLSAQLMLNLSTREPQQSGWYLGYQANTQNDPLKRTLDYFGVTFGYVGDANTYIWLRSSAGYYDFRQKQVLNGVDSRLLSFGAKQGSICLEGSYVFFKGEEDGSHIPRITGTAGLSFMHGAKDITPTKSPHFQVGVTTFKQIDVGIRVKITPQLMSEINYTAMKQESKLLTTLPAQSVPKTDKARAVCQIMEFKLLYKPRWLK